MEPVFLTRDSALVKTLEKCATHRYAMRLHRGESVAIAVTQQGVDVVLELFSPDGKRVTSVDAPTGREGDERLEVVAESDGTYVVVVRPFDKSEPAGKYRIAINAWRDPTATEQLLTQRAEARRMASDWLRARSGKVLLRGDQVPNDPDDRLAQFSLPPSPADSVDVVLGAMHVRNAIVTWSDAETRSAPDWLITPRQMHWVGALFSNEWLPHQWTLPQRLLMDFDGVVFLRKVTPETVPEIGKRRAP